ncbi:hypothetical protein Tco_0429598 [Tanacetum coccineum]
MRAAFSSSFKSLAIMTGSTTLSSCGGRGGDDGSSLIQEEEWLPPNLSKSHQFSVNLAHLQWLGKHRFPREGNHYPQRE